MDKDKKSKTIKKQKEKPVPDENEINNVLMAIGKKSRNPGIKNITSNFVNKIKSKTEGDNESQNSNRSAKSAKSAKSGKGTKGYKRPKSTFTDNLSKEEVEKKLEDYKKVDDISQVTVGTHLRYFVKKDGELIFRMGGNLKSNAGLPKFVILKNAEGIEWSVQVEGTIFYKKMIIQEIKDEYEEIIKELNSKIKKLKDRVKELEKK